MSGPTARQPLGRLLRSVLTAVARRQPRRVSAMLRVRNEEEFLAAAVRSIAELVDEIVIVDNLSDDGTPEIVRRLAEEYPDRLRALRYDHPVARVGAESRRLADSEAGRRSPALSANFYEFCRRRLRHPFALKWDGDMVALPELASSLARWRAGRALGMIFGGANVHPERLHQAAPRTADRAELEGRLAVPGLPRWVTAIDRDALEPRLFPRRFVRYTPRLGWTQTLDGPFRDAPAASGLWQREEEPQFLHLKFCKREPFLNYSDDLAAVIADNLVRGRPLPDDWRSVLERHGLVERAAS